MMAAVWAQGGEANEGKYTQNNLSSKSLKTARNQVEFSHFFTKIIQITNEDALSTFLCEFPLNIICIYNCFCILLLFFLATLNLMKHIFC